MAPEANSRVLSGFLDYLRIEKGLARLTIGAHNKAERIKRDQIVDLNVDEITRLAQLQQPIVSITFDEVSVLDRQCMIHD